MRSVTFNEIVGNENTKIILKEAIQSARIRKTRLEHIFLSGPSGCGKSTFASAIAHEMNTNYDYVMCSGDANIIQNIIMKIMKMKDNDILFLDEIHALKMNAKESIYDYLENGTLNIKYGMQVVNIKAPKVTIIGATTEIQLIPTPFLNRFPIQINLNKYSLKELCMIVQMNARNEGINLDMDAAMMIAQVSKGVPRMAIQYVRRVRNHAVSNNINKINKDVVQQCLKLSGINEDGLEMIEQKYIHTLYHVFNLRPAGLGAICSVIGENEKIVEKTYEPALISGGYIMKTPQGRVLTKKGIETAMKIEFKEII